MRRNIVDIDNLITSRIDGRKTMQPIRIKNEPFSLFSFSLSGDKKENSFLKLSWPVLSSELRKRYILRLLLICLGARRMEFWKLFFRGGLGGGGGRLFTWGRIYEGDWGYDECIVECMSWGYCWVHSLVVSDLRSEAKGSWFESGC